MITNERVGVLFIAVSLAIALFLNLVPLPHEVAAFRPAFYPMTVMFWFVMQPQRFGLIAAWCCGLPIDVLYGTPLAEHGLALAVACYGLLKLRGWFWSVPPIQQVLLILPVLAIYAFVLFWIDGAAGLAANLWWRWMPVATSAILWPVWSLLLERFVKLEVGA